MSFHTFRNTLMTCLINGNFCNKYYLFWIRISIFSTFETIKIIFNVIDYGLGVQHKDAQGCLCENSFTRRCYNIKKKFGPVVEPLGAKFKSDSNQSVIGWVEIIWFNHNLVNVWDNLMSIPATFCTIFSVISFFHKHSVSIITY